MSSWSFLLFWSVVFAFIDGQIYFLFIYFCRRLKSVRVRNSPETICHRQVYPAHSTMLVPQQQQCVLAKEGLAPRMILLSVYFRRKAFGCFLDTSLYVICLYTRARAHTRTHMYIQHTSDFDCLILNGLWINVIQVDCDSNNKYWQVW